MRPKQKQCRLTRAIRSELEAASDEALFFGTLAGLLREEQGLGRGEGLVPWLCRILHRAIQAEKCGRTSGRPNTDLALSGSASSARVWEGAVGDLVLRLLPRINPRYAEIIRRVELGGEMKLMVAAEFNISKATFNVTLHRARRALRREFEHYCSEAITEAPQ